MRVPTLSLFAALALALAISSAQAETATISSAPYVPFDAFFGTPGTYTQTVPANVYRLYADACSGGGAGSGTTGGGGFGGGGGSGAACLVHYPLPVTPGQTLTIVVAPGGVSATPTNGGVTSVSGTGVVFSPLAAGLSANISGTSATGASAAFPGTTGGTAPGNLGAANVLGPLIGGLGGATGVPNSLTPAGGSGIFPGGTGNNNGNPSSGAGGASAFGPGANSVTGSATGLTPSGYGGGGSGGSQFGGTGPFAGGNGAPGFVHLSTQ